MRWNRWIAAACGFAGVLIVVGPKLSGDGGIYNLVMLASAPLLAGSFLVTKALTRHERTGVILLWRAITVSLFSLPLALLNWQAPSLLQWTGIPALRPAGLGRALLSDAIVSGRRHIVYPIAEVSRSDLGRPGRLAGVWRHPHPGDSDRRLGDLRDHDLDRPARTQAAAVPADEPCTMSQVIPRGQKDWQSAPSRC